MTKKARLVMTTKLAKTGMRHAAAGKRPSPPSDVPTKSRRTKAAASPGPAPLGRAGTAVRESIAGSLTALGKAEVKIVALVKSAVASALGGAGTVTDEVVLVVHDVVTGAMQASGHVGTGLVVSVKGIAKGVVLGVNEVGGDIAKAAAETVKTVVKHATAVGADVSSIARRAVDGVMEAAIETGQDVSKTARAAIKSAIRAAGRVGSKSAQAVGDVLAGVARGLDDMVGESPDKRSIAPKRRITKGKTAETPARQVASAHAKKSATSTVKRTARNSRPAPQH